MTIAITTPTGNVGRLVVTALIRAGVRPRLLLRDPRTLDSALVDLVDAVQVDQRDGDAVVASTKGVHALFWVDPPTDDADPVAAYTRVGENAARAVTTNDIARTVFQSSVGAEKRDGAGEIDGLARTEEALDATGAAVLHLRCGFFFTNLLLQIDAIRAGIIAVSVPVDHPMPWVAPADIAQTAALRLLGPAWTGSHVQAVHGPTDLTWAQAARIITEVTGHRVRAEQIPDDQMRAMLTGTGMGPGQIDAVLGMSVGLRDHFTPEQTRSVQSTTPTGLAGWVYDNLRPAL